jgi:hypothetical protein
LPDGRVLIVGGILQCLTGEQFGSEMVTTSEIWDPVTGQFELAAELEFNRAGHTATLLPDGRVLIVGGYDEEVDVADAEVWDPSTGQFAAAGTLNLARSSHTATLLPDGRVLIVGGPRESTVAETWDPSTSSFSEAGSMAEPRWSHTASLLADGRVLIVGDQRRFEALAATEIWDPNGLPAKPEPSPASSQLSPSSRVAPTPAPVDVGSPAPEVDCTP